MNDIFLQAKHEMTENAVKSCAKKRFWKSPEKCVLILWVAFMGMHVYYLLLEFWNTQHPSYRPLAVFLLVQVLALLFAVVFGTARIVLRSKRLLAAVWVALGLLPVFIWYSQVSLSIHGTMDRRHSQVEMPLYLMTAEPVGAALIDGIARWTLPHQLEGDRVVMFYNDSIPDPEGELELMDAFIKKEEEFLQTSMPSKVHWIRSPLVGRGFGFAIHGLSVAVPNEYFTDEQYTVAKLDYHELAHNIIGLPSSFDVLNGTYPPTFLIEGWAMARTEQWDNLAKSCGRIKASGRELSLREVLSPKYYNQAEARIYDQGGAFTYVLLDKFGPEKYWELYHTTSRLNAVECLERIYGFSLDELESLYWNEIESYLASLRSYEQAVAACSSHEKALLDELREVYTQERSEFGNLCKQITLEWTIREASSENEFSQFNEGVFQSQNDHTRYYLSTKMKRTLEGKEQETRWNLCQLLLPDAVLSSFQSTHGQEDIFSIRKSPEEVVQDRKWIIREKLSEFNPLALFSGYCRGEFSDAGNYLWNPLPGTAIGMAEEGEYHVLKLKASPDELREIAVMMFFERDNGWLLREVKYTIILKGDVGARVEQHDKLEYSTETIGIPLMKKRCLESVQTKEDGSISRSVLEFELTKIETTPIPDTVFPPENMPLDAVSAFPKEFAPFGTRLARHLRIILIWLAIPLAVITANRVGRNKTSEQPCGE